MAEAKYTVVVELSHPTALQPGVPMRAFVLPTGNLSSATYADIREAAEKGGSQVRMFTCSDTGIENLKWELLHSSGTRLDSL